MHSATIKITKYMIEKFHKHEFSIESVNRYYLFCCLYSGT